MEKFSRWRDSATGIAPFIRLLPASTESLPPPLLLLLIPFSALLGAVRVLLVLLLLGAHTVLVEGVLRLFAFAPQLSRATSASVSRLILLVIGVLWIKVETVQLRKTGRSPPQVPFDPKKGDIIVSNSSSYVDLLYLAFRFNPTFLLPVTSASSTGKVSGFRRVSLLTAFRASGFLPQQSQDGGESLERALREARGPVVLFPEATTSNNRALLKFAELSQPALSAGGKATSAKVFVVAFKYSPPTRFAPSLTYPIPSSSFLGFPLPHLYSLTSILTPYTLTIRRLHPSESPRLTLLPGGNPKKEEWDALSETLAGAARLKKVGGLGWVEKGTFLEFRKAKGR